MPLQHLHGAFSASCDDHVTKSFGVEACFAVGDIVLREHRQKLEHSAGLGI
jgi:hypothetical protein